MPKPRKRPALDKLIDAGFREKAGEIAGRIAREGRQGEVQRELRKDRFQESIRNELVEWSPFPLTRTQKTYLEQIIDDARITQNKIRRKQVGTVEETKPQKQRTEYTARVVLEKTAPDGKQKVYTTVVLDELKAVNEVEIKRRYAELKHEDDFHSSDQFKFGFNTLDWEITNWIEKDSWESPK